MIGESERDTATPSRPILRPSGRKRAWPLAFLVVLGVGLLAIAGGAFAWRPLRDRFRGEARAEARPASPVLSSPQVSAPPAVPEALPAVPENPRATRPDSSGRAPEGVPVRTRFRVQLGAFRNPGSAEDLADYARRQGLSVKVQGPEAGRPSRLHHVLLDTPFARQIEAEKSATEIRRKFAIKAIVLRAE